MQPLITKNKHEKHWNYRINFNSIRRSIYLYIPQIYMANISIEYFIRIRNRINKRYQLYHDFLLFQRRRKDESHGIPVNICKYRRSIIFLFKWNTCKYNMDIFIPKLFPSLNNYNIMYNLSSKR